MDLHLKSRTLTVLFKRLACELPSRVFEEVTKGVGFLSLHEDVGTLDARHRSLHVSIVPGMIEPVDTE